MTFPTSDTPLSAQAQMVHDKLVQCVLDQRQQIPGLSYEEVRQALAAAGFSLAREFGAPIARVQAIVLAAAVALVIAAAVLSFGIAQ